MSKLILSPDELRTLVACADTGSFSAAAQRVHRTQSTVSGQVARVEELLGASAFHRMPRGVVPTTLGEQLLGYARRLLALQEEMQEVVLGVQPSGTLRLGLSEYIAPSRIGACLTALRERFPQLVLSVQTAQSSALLRRMKANEVDVMLGTALDTTLPAGAKLLGRESLKWVSLNRQRFQKGDEIPLVLLESSCSIHQDALIRLVKAGFKPRVVMTVSGALAVQAAVSAGVGLGYLNESAIGSGLVAAGRTSGLPEAGEVFPYVLLNQNPTMNEAQAARVVEVLLATLDLRTPGSRAR